MHSEPGTWVYWQYLGYVSGSRTPLCTSLGQARGPRPEWSWTGSWWPTDGRHSRQSSSPSTPPANRETPVASSTGHLRTRTTLILTVWLLVSAADDGVFVWLPAHLAGSGLGFVRGYGFLVLVALAQLPGYALAAWGIKRAGAVCPTLTSGFLILLATGRLLFIAASSADTVAGRRRMSFALLGQLGCPVCLYPGPHPTHARATGTGAAGAVARFGGLLAPTVMAPIVAASFGAAIGLFGSTLLLGSLFATWAIDVETTPSAFGTRAVLRRREISKIKRRFAPERRAGSKNREIGIILLTDFVKASNRLWDGGAHGDELASFFCNELSRQLAFPLSLLLRRTPNTRLHSVSELDCAQRL